MDIFSLPEGFHRNQIPGVVFGDEGGDKVYFINAVVGFSTAADHANGEPVIAITTGLETGFHLHAQQTLAVLGEEVIGKAVAVGLGDSDAVAGGAVHESEFGEFFHALAAETASGDVSPA